MSSEATYEVLPGVGVPPFLFGMTRAALQQATGSSGGPPDAPAWTYPHLRVEFDGGGKVAFLELSNLPGIRAIYEGIDVFGVAMGDVPPLLGGPHDEFCCGDIEADVFLTTCDGDHWDTIGVGTGGQFREFWEQRLTQANDFDARGQPRMGTALKGPA